MRKRIALFLFFLAVFGPNAAYASDGGTLCAELRRMKRPFVAFVEGGHLSHGPFNVGDVVANWRSAEQAYSVQTGIGLITSDQGVELSELGNASAFAEYKEVKSVCPKSRTFDVNIWIAKSHDATIPYAFNLDLPAIRAFSRDGTEMPLTPVDARILGQVKYFELKQ